MACKKTELVQAIQTYATARATNDPNLISFGANLLDQFLETIEFAPEEENADAAADGSDVDTDADASEADDVEDEEEGKGAADEGDAWGQWIRKGLLRSEHEGEVAIIDLNCDAACQVKKLEEKIKKI